MKTTVEVSDELLIEAKMHAAKFRTTIRALIESGLRHELNQKSLAADAKRPVIKWVTVPGGLPKDLDISDRSQMMDHLMSDRLKPHDRS